MLNNRQWDMIIVKCRHDIELDKEVRSYEINKKSSLIS